MGSVRLGDFGVLMVVVLLVFEYGISYFSVVDLYGNVVMLMMMVEFLFGFYYLVDGFIFNN